MAIAARVELIAVPDMPLVQAGDDLVGLVLDGVARADLSLEDGDVVVIAQKIVSKAEGRRVELDAVVPSAEALSIAAEGTKDPRLVELVLSESARIVRRRGDLLIAEHRLGLIMANAGVDQSNVEGGAALLLPVDPDASAERFRNGVAERTGRAVGVVVNDSFGRPWRRGTVGVALGSAGLPALLDRRGEPDLFGRSLQVTVIAYADEIAAAASLLMGQAAEGRPVVIVRGLEPQSGEVPARELIRPAEEDMFR
jgi:coenzyme F420-0:L-glutamate ligase / coenzyme F420-1:gamma-L-glutamate ligase